MNRIVGICLVRNEDVFVERALRNALGFCDRIIVADHQSTDSTWTIVKDLARVQPKIECHRIRRTPESQELIAGFVGTPTWIFGLDGDEIYDPAGLVRLRDRVLQGEFDSWWQVHGNVLNCVSLDLALGAARGYLAPPSRSMTKLFNFNALSSWTGDTPERLHGGHREFRPGYDDHTRLALHRRTGWEQSDYRCLHTCFLRRSSQDPPGGRVRTNIMEDVARPNWSRLGRRFLERLLPPGAAGWKYEKYRRGAQVTVRTDAFFR